MHIITRTCRGERGRRRRRRRPNVEVLGIAR